MLPLPYDRNERQPIGCSLVIGEISIVDGGLKPVAAQSDPREHSGAEESLDAFLADVQARALLMARMATGDVDEALDLVQDSMAAFVRRYAGKPPNERRPLFYRTLNNRITDWYRSRARRGRWLLSGSRASDERADGPDPVAQTQASAQPDGAAADDEFGLALERALTRLPARQRQVFLLRAWEGLNVTETARALGVGTGSIKTHYFRALASLRETLEAYDDRLKK